MTNDDRASLLALGLVAGCGVGSAGDAGLFGGGSAGVSASAGTATTGDDDDDDDVASDDADDNDDDDDDDDVADDEGTGGTGSESTSGTDGAGTDATDDGLVPGVCGDGEHNLGEECDDGNFDNTDGCTEYCLLPACGDGYVQPGNAETCDDGNGIDGDGCNGDCIVSGAAVWTVSFDGMDGNDDIGRAVAADAGGSVVVAGSTEVAGEDANVFLWKVSAADGSEVWNRDVLGTGFDSAYDVAINSQDEIVATGTFYVGAQPDPGGKIWTASFSEGGNELWSATTDGDGTGTAVVVGPDDAVYATGDITGTNGPNLWLHKRDASGNAVWTTQDVYGSDSSCTGHYHENPEGIAIDPPQVYVTWRSTCPAGSASPRTKVSRFDDDDGGVSYNPDGCCSHWRIDVFTPGVFVGTPTRGYDMARGPEDELVIVGEANNGGYVWGYGEDLASPETYNAAAWEVDPGGATFVDVVIDPEGNIVLAGVGGRVVKLTPDGEFLWEHAEPGIDVHGVTTDAAGFVYATGSEPTPGQGQDVWLRKLAP